MITPFNLYILNTPHDSWENCLIKELKEKGLLKKVIIQKAASESKQKFLNLATHGLDGEYKHVPEEIYNRLYTHLFEFIDMYSRVNLHNSGEYNELNIHQHLDHFNLMINYYYSVFTENDISLFIHNNSPHVGYDYIPNLLAEELGIQTLYLEQSNFPNKFFYYWKLKDYGQFDTTDKIFDFPEKIKLENKHEKDLPYMKSVRNNTFNFSSLLSLKKFNTELNNHLKEYQLIKDLIKSDYRGQAYSRYKLKKEYKRNRKGLAPKIDLDEPFIYFGLHLQPEKSTSSWGGKYADQALALEHLSAILPKDWKIYVKENPKQTYFMRNPEFFRRLERIPNLVMVSSEYNTYDLIKKSKINATITGSIGWESITGGKPAIIFGWGVWYKTLPGIYSFSFDLNLEKISTKKVSFTELQSQFNKLYGDKLAPGIILNEYYPSIYKDYDVEENNRQVSDSIEKIILSNFKNL